VKILILQLSSGSYHWLSLVPNLVLKHEGHREKNIFNPDAHKVIAGDREGMRPVVVQQM
jgi:hypothetical protein